MSSSGAHKYAMVYLFDGRNNNPSSAAGLADLLERESKCLYNEFAKLKAAGARIVVVVLGRDTFYGEVKVCGDALCLPTQCARLDKVEKKIRQYETNLLMKMNPKLGGTNCTLTQRGTPRGPSFQQPPESISWMFDAKAMVV
ncbi:hypothetical protein B484DRAFT_439536, partial [Ochromonadaceae sp. CCMP2298]